MSSDGRVEQFPDTANSALVRDHPYKTTKSSFLCDTCGLGQASHFHPESENYVPEGKYRCPDCVTKGIVPCPHQKK